MAYKYCSICGSRLKLKKGNLACVKCRFVNYRNPRPTVTVLVLNKNKLLLTRRRRAPFKGWWDLPGGFLDRGENTAACARRELKEEMALHIKIRKLFGIYVGTYPSVFDPFSVVSTVYLATSREQSPKALDDVSESRWFVKKEIPAKIAFDSNQLIIKDFLKIWK